jgi:hypothetical protein
LAFVVAIENKAVPGTAAGPEEIAARRAAHLAAAAHLDGRRPGNFQPALAKHPTIPINHGCVLREIPMIVATVSLLSF